LPSTLLLHLLLLLQLLVHSLLSFSFRCCCLSSCFLP
jgi:hypothetical protein